ncbi:AMP-binding protein [Streptomyces sp. NPDC007157]|uniref:AMP-binding protein n=1 Tax=Streptomyces sp. NPDC007157 TaxID=3154681 RepID=UPI0033CBA31F
MPLRHLTPRDQHLFWQYGRGAGAPVHEPLVHRAVERHAIAHPHAVAAEHHGATLTYGELDRYAGALAAHLVREGVRPGDHVGLFARRSIPTLVGLLAVLKAGAAYVPQDIGRTSPDRLRHVVRTARTRVILTQKEHAPRIPLPDGHRLIALDDPVPYQRGTPIVLPHPDDGCHVLFAAGRAEAVKVTHRNVTNLLLTEPGGLGIRPGDRVAQLLDLASGLAAWEILGCLTRGATLVIRGADPTAAARTATVLIATPAVLSGIDPAGCPRLRTVAVAGEPGPPRPLADLWSRHAALFDCRGPAEAAVVTTMARHDPAAGRPAGGHPVPNTTVYVLDADRRPLPVGESGEVWAGGDCVPAGHLGDSTRNAGRYAPDPFLGEGRAMLRTGALGRWTPDGALEHLGRAADIRAGTPTSHPRTAGGRPRHPATPSDTAAPTATTAPTTAMATSATTSAVATAATSAVAAYADTAQCS